LDVLGEVIRW